LPPRRATLPEDIEPPQSPPVLHSPFSPLSPISPLYPDGVIDALWLRKHQELVPSVLLCFYSLTSDLTLATLHDNKIKVDINHIRSSLSQSGYRTRLAVVAFGDESTRAVSGLQERLDNIRKGCGIDSKAFFFVPPHETPEKLERVAENTLTTIYAQANDYYMELTRHARKKKSRGVVPQPTVPPTSGTSQTLSLAGWNVRYDFKSGVFAEFRQEMDNALRSFEQAYENLLGSELLEIIPSWSPRWNDARLLADVISIRCLRCLVWSGKHTAAVRRWQYHRDRIADLVDRRGRGTKNYGWQAWEARWALAMADLIDNAEIQDLEPSTLTLYLQPEKGVMGERLQPWELLHHTGYWYRLSAKHLYGRRAYAYAMPEDDRRPPSSSPATHVASKAFTYDTYMCPDPHEEYPLDGIGTDHSRLILDRLMRARSEFQKRQQLRLSAELSLECARELASSKRWSDVVELLEPLWQDMSFRAEGWRNIAEDLSWCLRSAASHSDRADLVVAIDLELMDKSRQPAICSFLLSTNIDFHSLGFTRRPKWHYDITKSLHGLNPKPDLTIKTDDSVVLSFLSASFVFRNEEGKAGEAAPVQLSITSNAHQDAAPVVLKKIEIYFVGSIKTVVLQHEETSGQHSHRNVTLSSVSLEEESADGTDSTSDDDSGVSRLVGSANLSLLPGHTTVFNMEIPLREPGEASANSFNLFVSCEDFQLEYGAKFRELGASELWFLSAASKKRVPRANTRSLRILPRPPKMEIRKLALMDEYYTNETIELRFELVNAEDEDSSARLEVFLVGDEPPSFGLQIDDGDMEDAASGESDESRLLVVPVGTIQATGSTLATVQIQPIDRSTRHNLTLRVTYHLASDPATTIIQTASFQLNVVNPFEANYDLLPRLHPDPWPSLFDYEGVQNISGEDDAAIAPNGLSQAWCLVTRYASFASESLNVTGLGLSIRAPPNVRCFTTNKDNIPAGGRQVSPKTIEEAAFDIVTQKISLDDRGPTSLDVSFIIKWSRVGAGSDPEAVNTTVLPVPRLNIFGTEPRVLVSTSYLKEPHHLVVLDVVIENVSNHFLTFGLTMEPSDEFAFSGSKQTTLHLLPVSRRSTTYRLLPLVRGTWIKPGLVVRDKYFQKVLRVIPTEGMKLDKDGFSVWVPAEDENEAEVAAEAE
jgi:hypothetical protein